MVEKRKITLSISVGYNCHQWLINRGVHLWETCSIKFAGQCVCRQIALVYFPWCLSPALYSTCFISCPAWLHWCVSVVTSRVPSVSDSQKAEGERIRPMTSDPLTQDDPQLIRCVCLPNIWSTCTTTGLKNTFTLTTQTQILIVSYDAEINIERDN